MCRHTVLVLVAVLAIGSVARGEKLDEESRKWLEGVSAIALGDESKAYRQLKDRAERVEFEKIFWARRDPDLRTAENEYQQEFLARRSQADQRFGGKGFAGSATGCGRLFILLGEPDSVREAAGEALLGGPPGSNGAERSSATEFTAAPKVTPQVWIYKDRRDITFPGGEARFALDTRCAVSLGVSAKLDRIASAHVVNPGLTFRIEGGRIARLADLLPKPTAALGMLEAGRTDFPVAGQVSYIRAEGSTALIGLARAETAPAGSGKAAALTVAAEAVTEDGRVVAVDERALTAAIDDKGGALLSYRLFLKPGHYTLRYGVLDEKGGKGAAASEGIDVPDLGGSDLSTGSLMVVRDLVEGATANAAEPLDAFTLGGVKLVPRFGNAFRRSETVHFFYSVNGGVDDATGRSNLTVGLSLLKGRALLASTPDQSFTEPHVVSSVGPVELAFEPGTYTARLTVKDRVSQKDATVDQTFRVE